MPSSFPTSYDNFIDPSSLDTLQSADHAGKHSDVNDAIESTQIKVGVDDSLDIDSIDYLLNHVSTGQLVSGSIDFQKLATSVQQLMTPAGTVRDYIGTTAPTGWLFLDGATVPNGRYLFPSLYAAQPELFSGDDLVLLDSRNSLVRYESSQPWAVGGTQSLTYSNPSNTSPPAHNHDIADNHRHGFQISTHSHAVAHNHFVSSNNQSIVSTGNAAYSFYWNDFTMIALSNWNGGMNSIGNNHDTTNTNLSTVTLNNTTAFVAAVVEGSNTGASAAIPTSLVVRRMIKVH
jgi:hypothetical protein